MTHVETTLHIMIECMMSSASAFMLRRSLFHSLVMRSDHLNFDCVVLGVVMLQTH